MVLQASQVAIVRAGVKIVRWTGRENMTTRLDLLLLRSFFGVEIGTERK
jgi:hypothetical protein